jgi:hypothetical protein
MRWTAQDEIRPLFVPKPATKGQTRPAPANPWEQFVKPEHLLVDAN